MKIRNLLLITTPVLLSTGSISPIISSCSCTNGDIKNIPVYNKWVVEDHQIKWVDSGYYIPVRTFNGSTVPYLDIYTYTKICFGTSTPAYTPTVDAANEKVIIENNINPSKCTIDFKNQKIIFDDYDSFISLSVHGAFTQPLTNSMAYFNDVSEQKYVAGQAFTIDLTKYKINIYFKDGIGYLPYDVIRNVIGFQALAYMFYNGKGFYKIVEGNAQAVCDAYQKLKAESNIYTPEYMEYTYNLFALTLDMRYGLTERVSRAHPGTTNKILPNGAYALLQPLHDKLVSTEAGVATSAYIEVFNKYIDDGGHTRWFYNNVMDKEPFDGKAPEGDETQHTFAVDEVLTTARNKTNYNFVSFWYNEYWSKKPEGEKKTPLEVAEWITENQVNSYYTEYKMDDKPTIAYITFDEFKQDKRVNWSLEEQVAGRELPENTDESNYWQDTMRLTMYANKQIKDHGIKNVVIDLSNNGGGAVYSEYFIASWLCNGVIEKMYNPHTKGYKEFKVNADINADGKFNEEDYIGSDVQLYVITTSKSFSCGNMLSCNIADSVPTAVFIGEKSGGGACYVDEALYTGLGNFYQTSSSLHALKKSSTETNFVTNDTGAGPESGDKYYINPLVDDGADKIYNREAINKEIWGI